VEFIETSVFSRQIATLFNDEVYRELQLGLAGNPGLGRIIKGSGGIRKVRVASSFSRETGMRSRHLLLGGPEGRDLVAPLLCQE
jgi:hypothetical protein